MIYFIKSGNKHVKIGYTANLSRRVKELQTGNPLYLTVLGTIPGGKETEQELHKLYDKYRIKRKSTGSTEWFKINGTLRGIDEVFKKNNGKVTIEITDIRSLQQAILQNQITKRSNRKREKGNTILSSKIKKIQMSKKNKIFNN